MKKLLIVSALLLLSVPAVSFSMQDEEYGPENLHGVHMTLERISRDTQKMRERKDNQEILKRVGADLRNQVMLNRISQERKNQLDRCREVPLMVAARIAAHHPRTIVSIIQGYIAVEYILLKLALVNACYKILSGSSFAPVKSANSNTIKPA